MNSTPFGLEHVLDKCLSNSTVEAETPIEDAFMKKVWTFLTFRIASFIAMYWLPILIPIGIVGNTLSFLVMVKPNNRKMSTCIYMAAISVNDNFMMFLSLYAWLVTDIKIHSMIQVECIIVAYFVLLTLQNSTYQVLAMTVDKYIAIKWPHKAAVYSTPRRAKMTVIVVYICVLIYNSPHLALTRIVGSQCLGYAKGGIFTQIHSWLTFVLNGVIPFILLISMNYVIINTVRRSRENFENTNADKLHNKGHSIADKNPSKAMKNAENQLTIMLILVTSLFLVLLIPTYIRFMYSTYVNPDTPKKYATFMLFYHISHKLYSTNNAINFFLYCISGRKFRTELKEILCSSRKSSSKFRFGDFGSNDTEVRNVRSATD